MKQKKIVFPSKGLDRNAYKDQNLKKSLFILATMR